MTTPTVSHIHICNHIGVVAGCTVTGIEFKQGEKHTHCYVRGQSNRRRHVISKPTVLCSVLYVSYWFKPSVFWGGVPRPDALRVLQIVRELVLQLFS